LLLQVGGHEARTLEASWSADSASLGRVPRVRLTEEMPVLELRAKDSSGKVRNTVGVLASLMLL
jgi:hypothetical protein